MNMLKNISKQIEKGLADNTKLAVISLVLAIILWLMISMGLDQSAAKTINDIELITDISGTTLEDNELSIIPFAEQPKISIKIKCSKTQIRNLNSDTFEAYLDLDGITSPVKKTLPVKIRNTKGIKCDIESITPSTVTIEIDKISTKEIPVYPKADVTPAEGKVLDEYICEPNVVSIYGPSSRLDKIDKCYACPNKNYSEVDSSFNIPLTAENLQLYSADDVKQDHHNINFIGNTSFVITVPVLTQKIVTPVVEISNVPENFNKELLKQKLKFSPETLVIASNNSNAEISDTFEVQKINLSDIDLGYSKDFDISEKISNSNVINKSGTDTVNVSLDGTGLTRKEITLDSSSIHISDIPRDNYNYQSITPKLTFTVVGPAEVVGKLSSKDFVASASLLNIDKSEQKLNFDATISCLTSDEVWSVTKATISIVKTPRSVELPISSASTSSETED